MMRSIGMLLHPIWCSVISLYSSLHARNMAAFLVMLLHPVWCLHSCLHAKDLAAFLHQTSKLLWPK